MYPTPILLIIFNRPDFVETQIKRLRELKPKYLYISADGPRKNNDKDMDNCNLARSIINSIDWDCRIRKKFEDHNLGCKRGVSSAIDWFFQNEERGIILEDDCLASNSFFRFCEELLHRYENNKNIWQISGNSLSTTQLAGASYTFSKYFGSIWGWATWKDRWAKYEVDLNFSEIDKIKKEGLNVPIHEEPFMNHVFSELDYIREGMDTWDFQWRWCKAYNSGLSIVPSMNLIRNVGVGIENATHTKSDRFERVFRENEIAFPLCHPKQIVSNHKLESQFFANNFDSSLYYRIKRFVRRNISKIFNMR